MKRRLIAAGVVALVLLFTFGAGYWASARRVAALRSQALTAETQRQTVQAEARRREVPLATCLGALELRRRNFGNAADKLAQAREAATKVPELRPLGARFQDAEAACRRLDPEAEAQIEGLLNTLLH
jgi:hypothetical protein